MSRYGILISGSRIVATFALALLGTGAELFQGHPVGETHAGNCCLSERDAPCVLKCRPGLERVAPVDSVVQQEALKKKHVVHSNIEGVH